MNHNDQASRLRERVEAIRQEKRKEQIKTSSCRSVAIVSGKGGVGKSNIATNFAIQLARHGERVLLVDLDLGMGNVHILLGERPMYHLNDYLERAIPYEQVKMPYFERLDYISGGSTLQTIFAWDDDKMDRLFRLFERASAEYDTILFDMGAGISQETIALIRSVDDVIVVATPEPTSITDAYSMMKYIILQSPEQPVHLISNRTPSGEPERTGKRLQETVRQFLKKEVTVLGSLEESTFVQRAVIEQQPFSIRFPNEQVAQQMEQIAKKWLGLESDTKENGKPRKNWLEQFRTFWRGG